jgi:hypothetical protein
MIPRYLQYLGKLSTTTAETSGSKSSAVEIKALYASLISGVQSAGFIDVQIASSALQVDKHREIA